MVHVAIALVGLLVFSAFAVDYGVLWASRRQAQNAADAGALAGATALAYGKPPANVNNTADPVYTAAAGVAATVARRNLVWGTPPRVDPASATKDVEFINCPPPLAQNGIADKCVRVDAYRNQQGGTGNVALPTFFAQLAGVSDQGVRATATASILAGNAVPRCVKPFAVPDRWLEGGTTPAVFPDTFELATDVYDPSVTRWRFPDDYGATILLHGPSDVRIVSSWAQLIAVAGQGGGGPNGISTAISTCLAVSAKINPTWSDFVLNKTGGTEGGVKGGIADVRSLYPDTVWNHQLQQLECSGPAGCNNNRLGAVPIVSPVDLANGREDIGIIDFMGIFIEGMGDDADVVANHQEILAAFPSASDRKKLVIAHVIPFAAVLDGSAGPPRPSSFARVVVLVR